MEFKFFLPTRVFFGNDAVNNDTEYLKQLGKSCLLVTGRSSSKKNGSLNDITFVLKTNDISYEIYDEVEENPSFETVEAIGKKARESGIDFLIGIGGGSAMDSAKAGAILATNDMDAAELWTKNLVNKPLPVCAVPTTSGTGSEVTQYSVLTNREKKSKRGFANEQIFPVVSYLDPRYTLTMNDFITINTGIDALSHAVEGYLSKRASPLTDEIALRAIGLIRDHLPMVLRSPNSLEERSQMMYASMLAGIVIAHTGTIVLHGMGYPLTTYLGIPHGRANGMLMCGVLEMIRPSRKEKVAKIAECFGKENGDLSGLEAFIKELNIDTTEYRKEATKDMLEEFADFASRTSNIRNTPGTITKEEIRKVYLREFT